MVPYRDMINGKVDSLSFLIGRGDLIKLDKNIPRRYLYYSEWIAVPEKDRIVNIFMIQKALSQLSEEEYQDRIRNLAFLKFKHNDVDYVFRDNIRLAKEVWSGFGSATEMYAGEDRVSLISGSRLIHETANEEGKYTNFGETASAQEFQTDKYNIDNDLVVTEIPGSVFTGNVRKDLDAKRIALSRTLSSVLRIIYTWNSGIPNENMAEIGNRTDTGAIEKFGYINKKGDIVIPLQFDAAKKFESGLARVKKGDKWGMIDFEGNVVIPFSYNDIFPFNEGLALSWNSGNFGYIDIDNTIRIPHTLNGGGFFNEGLAKAKKGKTWGFINTDGEFTILPTFEKVSDFHNKVAFVRVDKKWGLLNKNGEYVIIPTFDKVESFSDSIAAVKVNKKWGYINTSGKWIIEAVYDNAKEYSEELFCVKQKDKWGRSNKHFRRKLRYSIYRGQVNYDMTTIVGIAKAIHFEEPKEYTTVIYVDGLKKSKRHTYGSELRKLGVSTHKVQGVTRDESNSLIRLADTVAGFVRDVIDGERGEVLELFKRAKGNGGLIEV